MFLKHLLRFLQLFEKHNVKKKNVIKLKSPGELQVCMRVCVCVCARVRCAYVHYVCMCVYVFVFVCAHMGVCAYMHACAVYTHVCILIFDRKYWILPGTSWKKFRLIHRGSVTTLNLRES